MPGSDQEWDGTRPFLDVNSQEQIERENALRDELLRLESLVKDEERRQARAETDVEAIHGDENSQEGPELLTVENAPLVAVVLQMKIYDALLAILNKLDPDNANWLASMHDQGIIVTGPPIFAGFATESD